MGEAFWNCFTPLVLSCLPGRRMWSVEPVGVRLSNVNFFPTRQMFVFGSRLRTSTALPNPKRKCSIPQKSVSQSCPFSFTKTDTTTTNNNDNICSTWCLSDNQNQKNWSVSMDEIWYWLNSSSNDRFWFMWYFILNRFWVSVSVSSQTAPS